MRLLSGFEADGSERVLDIMGEGRWRKGMLDALIAKINKESYTRAKPVIVAAAGVEPVDRAEAVHGA